MLKPRASARLVACFFVLTCGSYATNVSTSTACSLAIQAAPRSGNNPGAVPLNLTQVDPTLCDLAGSSGGDPYYVYDVTASVVGTGVSGGAIGSISTGTLSAAEYVALTYLTAPDPSAPKLPGNGFFQASAQSEVDSQFTTSGPVRMGTLIFTASFPIDVLNGENNGTGTITLTQEGVSIGLAGTCEYERFVGSSCQTESVPIELGVSFELDAKAGVYQAYNSLSPPISSLNYYGESGTFMIEELDGTPVVSTLVSTVPEPAVFLMSGLPLALLALGVLRRKRVTV